MSVVMGVGEDEDKALAKWAGLAIALLLTWAAVGIGLVVALFVQADLLMDAVVGDDERATAARQVSLLAGALVPISVVTAASFITWVTRFDASTRVMDHRRLDHEPSVLKYGWFTPHSGVYRPRRAIIGLWHANDAKRPRRFDFDRLATPLIDVWWTMFVLGGVTVFGVGIFLGDGSEAARRARAWSLLAGAVLLVGASIAAMVLVQMLGRRHRQLQKRLDPGQSIIQDSAGSPGLRRLLTVVAGAGILASAAAVSAETLAITNSQVQREPLGDLEIGTCWTPDSEENLSAELAVRVLDCSDPHRYELVGGYRIDDNLDRGGLRPRTTTIEDVRIAVDRLLLDPAASCAILTFGVPDRTIVAVLIATRPYLEGDRVLACHAGSSTGELTQGVAAVSPSPLAGRWIVPPV